MDYQCDQIRSTDNGPTVEDEEILLREMFGDPDDDGVYGREVS